MLASKSSPCAAGSRPASIAAKQERPAQGWSFRAVWRMFRLRRGRNCELPSAEQPRQPDDRRAATLAMLELLGSSIQGSNSCPRGAGSRPASIAAKQERPALCWSLLLWAMQGSNLRPFGCDPNALPTELIAPVDCCHEPATPIVPSVLAEWERTFAGLSAAFGIGARWCSASAQGTRRASSRDRA